MLEALITSRTRRDLLALLFTNPDLEFYMREISRKINSEINAVRAELQSLEDAGVLASERKGNLKYFRVNKKCPIFDELRKIIIKTEGVGSAVRDALTGSNARFSFIFGSCAKGTEVPASDVDLMVIGDIPRMEEFNEKLSNAERRIGRDINYSIYPEGEFLKKLPSNAFLSGVSFGKKIMILGEENEFKRFIEGGKRKKNKEKR